MREPKLKAPMRVKAPDVMTMFSNNLVRDGFRSETGSP